LCTKILTVSDSDAKRAHVVRDHPVGHVLQVDVCSAELASVGRGASLCTHGIRVRVRAKPNLDVDLYRVHGYSKVDT